MIRKLCAMQFWPLQRHTINLLNLLIVGDESVCTHVCCCMYVEGGVGESETKCVILLFVTTDS